MRKRLGVPFLLAALVLLGHSATGRSVADIRRADPATAGQPVPAWVGATLLGGSADDWEPAIATDPSSPYVYVLVTRLDGEPACATECPTPVIVLLVSSDGGRTFAAPRYPCRCRGVKDMFDPQIEVTADGAVYAVWMNDFDIVFAKSSDHAKTWTKPVPVYLPRRWSDKPILATSATGRAIYVAFNGPSVGDSYVAQSHDFGETWQKPIKVVDSARYFFAGGGQVLPDGTIVFAQASERQSATGRVRIHAILSADAGATWQDIVVDVVEESPPCVSQGCYRSYYEAGAALAADASGSLVLLYQGATRPGGPQRMYVRRSPDGGAKWSDRRAISPMGAIAAFPAAVGTGDGEFRIWYMDDRQGHDAWNVWYRSSLDGGRTWTKGVRISDAVTGAPHMSERGFGEPYGDYGEIDITSKGETVAVWGAAASYAGPGGSWFNRTRRD